MTNDTTSSQALSPLRLETLQTQRAKWKVIIIIIMFKLLNDLAPSPLTELFAPKNKVTDYNLRGSSTSLQLPKPRTEKLN